MTDRDLTWVRVANFATPLEAHLAVSRLEDADIPAVARSHDTVGIFGPGFQGATARGVDVLVPSTAVEKARAVLADEEFEEDYDDEEL